MKKKLMEEKMAKAAENRELQLQATVRKAKDEEQKVHEIAFINTLETDGRRHDVLARHQDVEHRLQSIQEERQKKAEEASAREAAVQVGAVNERPPAPSSSSSSSSSFPRLLLCCRSGKKWPWSSVKRNCAS